MRLAARLVVLLLLFSLLPFPHLGFSASAPSHALNPGERAQAHVIARLAARHPYTALAWARSQAGVASAILGADRRSLQIAFRDGAQLAVVPPLHLAPTRSPMRAFAIVR